MDRGSIVSIILAISIGGLNAQSAACSYSWVATPSSNIPGGTYTFAPSLAACQSGCLTNGSCTGVDWDGTYCYYTISTATLGTLVVGKAQTTTHYDIVWSCISASGCVLPWTLSRNSNVPGGTYYAPVSLSVCVNACFNNTSCTGVDYQSPYCWLVFPGLTFVNGTAITTNHYDINRNACGTTSTTTTQSSQQTTGGVCWILSPNSNVANGNYVAAGTGNLTACQLLCVADIACTGVDYVYNQGPNFWCYNIITSDPTLFHNGTVQGINHYDIVRGCTNGQTPTTPTTQAANQQTTTTSQAANQPTTTQAANQQTTTTNLQPPPGGPSCTTEYSISPNTNSVGGLFIPSITNPTLCGAACTQNPQCLGNDINYSNPPSYQCYLYISGINGANFATKYTTQLVAQTTVNRCATDGLYLCTPNYSAVANQASQSGVANAAGTTIAQCQTICQTMTSCAGFDWPGCWIHTTANIGNTYTNSGGTQYIKTDACVSTCYPTWSTLVNMAAPGGVVVSSSTYPTTNNLTACLEYCLRNPDCVGIQFQPGNAQQCTYYPSAQKSTMTQVTPTPNAVQYTLTNRCSTACSVSWTPNYSTAFYLLNPVVHPEATTLSQCNSLCRVSATCVVYQVTRSPQAFQCQLADSYVAYSGTSDSNHDTYFYTETCSGGSQNANPATPGPGGQPGGQPGVSGTTPALGPVTTTTSTTGLGGAGCTSTWTTGTPNSNVLGGVSNSASGSVTACQAACTSSNSSCTGVDYNPSNAAGNQCWLIFTSVPGQVRTGAAPGITHYDVTTTCSSGAPGPGGCTSTWTVGIPNSNVFGGVSNSASGSVTACQSACTSSNSSCTGVDYDPTNAAGNQCWLIFNGVPAQVRTGAAPGVTHYDVTRTCSSGASGAGGTGVTGAGGTGVTGAGTGGTGGGTGVTGAGATGGCSVTWNVTPNSNVAGGTSNTANTLTTCETACTTTPSCSGIDFNPSTGGCWLTLVSLATRVLGSLTGVNHYDMINSCTGSSTVSGTGTGACAATWVATASYHGFGGTINTASTTSAACLTACAALSATSCGSYDFDTNGNVCWILPSAALTGPSTGPTITHYVRPTGC